MKEELIERLSRYAKIDTQSDASSETVPSTDKQWNLLKELETELNAIGMSDVNLDDKGYLFAALPANTEGKKQLDF